MAKLHEEKIEIKISELLRDNQSSDVILDPETLDQLIAVIEELVGSKRIVEVIVG